MYGAFTRVGCALEVGGPRFRLDLSNYRSLRLSFSGAEDPMNLRVTYFTAASLNPAAPDFYSSNDVDVRPAASGAALEAVPKVGDDPRFSWRQVDGIVITINRSGLRPHTSYTLERLTFGFEP